MDKCKLEEFWRKKAINYFKGKIPSNKMYEIIESKYKDKNQQINASKRIAVKSIDTTILEITKTLTISKKKKLLNYITKSIIATGKDMEENTREREEYLGWGKNSDG